MEKYYGVLYYRNKKSKFKKILQGPPGVGFRLTNDGNYDIENKRLVNVNEPEDDKVVVIYSIFVRNINELIKDLADLDNRLESLKTDNNDRGEYMEELKRNVRLNTAVLEAFKSEQNILNDFVRINLYNLVFIGVANNVNITSASNVVEFEKVISSTNIRIININDRNALSFNYEGYYRLTIQFYSLVKFNPYVSITLNGNAKKKLIHHKKLATSYIIKNRYIELNVSNSNILYT